MKNNTKKTLWTAIAVISLNMGVFGGMILGAHSYKPKNTIRIENPVFNDKGEEWGINKCEEGTLRSIYKDTYTRDDEPCQIRHAVDKDVLRIKYDNLPHQRPFLEIGRQLNLTDKIKGRFVKYTLHLRQGEKIPLYEYYGNSGALTSWHSGGYPCPKEQWTDE